jgi:transitional endoplasmic reticulum ATPase
VRHIFNVARRASPCIVFFDQLDAVLSRRGDADHEGSRAPQRVVNQLLAELDGMEQLGDVIVIGATNRIAMVDPAALRPGRFGVHLYVGLPDEHDRAEILRIHLRDTSLEPGCTVETLIEHLLPMTDGLSGADLAFMCQTAKLDAMQEVDFQSAPRLAPRHFDAVLPELKGAE